ncbi:MAG: hypothetical protein ACXVRN_08835, partial [Solirubrobacteraceae bacterium]
MRSRLAQWLARRDRGRLVHWLILRMLPRAIARRFDPGAARGLDATVELAIRHDSRPASYALAIAGERCSVSAGTPARAGARATIGADDLILLCARAFAGPGDVVAVPPDPTYSLFRVAAELAGATIGDDTSALTFCCRSGNPLGDLPPLPDARPLVVDEAYFEY